MAVVAAWRLFARVPLKPLGALVEGSPAVARGAVAWFAVFSASLFFEAAASGKTLVASSKSSFSGLVGPEEGASRWRAGRSCSWNSLCLATSGWRASISGDRLIMPGATICVVRKGERAKRAGGSYGVFHPWTLRTKGVGNAPPRSKIPAELLTGICKCQRRLGCLGSRDGSPLALCPEGQSSIPLLSPKRYSRGLEHTLVRTHMRQPVLDTHPNSLNLVFAERLFAGSMETKGTRKNAKRYHVIRKR